jgi:hypothetical protein
MAPLAWSLIVNAMAPNKGAKGPYNVQPEPRGQEYINVYWRKCPFKVIPHYRADVNNHTRTNLEVVSRNTGFAVNLSKL